jgi:hypothetical protein
MKNELKEANLQGQFCWIKAIPRDDLLNNKPKLVQFIKNGYICGRHFVKGHIFSKTILIGFSHRIWVTA